MHILLVAATESEVADLKPRLERNADLLITGVGMVAPAVRCARLLAQDNFDLVLNVGLCGSFDPGLKPGTVVHVARDRIAELGAEDGDTFLTMTELKLPAECEFTNLSPPNIAALKELQVVGGVTVNTAHGNERSIAAGDAQITKLSYHAYAYCAERFVLLDAGGALGRNCGPLLISKRAIAADVLASGQLRIAIPGKYTTANLLLGLAFPKAQNKSEWLLSDIAD